jgi:signal transduction histidine kinase
MLRDSLFSHARSLRARLMLWNAGAVAATGLLILLAVRLWVPYTLLDDLDHVLTEDLNEIKLHFEGNKSYDWEVITEELERKAEGHDFHHWFVRFYDDKLQLKWSTSKNKPDLPPPTPEQQQRGKPYSVGDYRLLFSRLDPPLKEGVAVCVGCSQLSVSRAMATIDRLVVSAGLVVLLISPIVGNILTGRVIQPLAQMIRTTARLHPGEVSERLPIRGTGDELDSLAKTINGLLDRIARYLQQKHDFLANAAHDLRTPLAAIRSSVEVALASDRSEEDYRELLGVVIEQCSALQTLVNQLLLLSESDADRLQINTDPVPLDEVISRAVEMFEGVADDKGVELRCGELPPVAVPGNRNHLRQVVNNLLDNAIKFTAAHADAAGEGCSPGDAAHRGCVEVDLEEDRSSRVARLKIRDNGIGIGPADLPYIFDRFYRADKARARDGVAGGTGLGLSICKAIVDAHGGEIGVDSQLGRGTVFTVTLPLITSATSISSPEDSDQLLELP